MELLAISLSGKKQLEFAGRKAQTGICKQAVEGPVQVLAESIEGDVQVDRKNHGGADKAVYAYAAENYRFWEQELGRLLPYGQFGENLAVSGLTDEHVHIGDIFRIGRQVECQVTQPRVPCFKLGMRMGDSSFVARFHQSGRVGYYFRVLKKGMLQVGDSIERLHTDPARLSVAEAMLALNKNPRQQEIIRRALDIPALSAAWRESLRKRLK
jgi:MOSC domain-containing protein YiiM